MSPTTTVRDNLFRPPAAASDFFFFDYNTVVRRLTNGPAFEPRANCGKRLRRPTGRLHYAEHRRVIRRGRRADYSNVARALAHHGQAVPRLQRQGAARQARPATTAPD